MRLRESVWFIRTQVCARPRMQIQRQTDPVKPGPPGPWASVCVFPIRRCCNEVARANHKLLLPCHRGRTAEATGRSGWFSTVELFPSTPNFFSSVPSGCWGCSRGTRQRVAMKMMGEMVPGASASLPARALFGSESSRGSARSYGRCFGTGMEQPRRCFMQQGTGAAKVANMSVSPGLEGKSCNRKGVQDQARAAVAEMRLVQRGLDVRWQQRAATEEARHRCCLAWLAIVLCKKKKKSKFGLISFQTTPRTSCKTGKFPTGFSYGVFP